MDKVTVILFGIVQFVLFVLIVSGVLGPVFGLVLMACVAWGMSGSGSDAKPPATPYQSSSSPVLDSLALIGMLSLLDDDDDGHDFDGDDGHHDFDGDDDHHDFDGDDDHHDFDGDDDFDSWDD